VYVTAKQTCVRVNASVVPVTPYSSIAQSREVQLLWSPLVCAVPPKEKAEENNVKARVVHETVSSIH
jgi:hypothetical protein